MKKAKKKTAQRAPKPLHRPRSADEANPHHKQDFESLLDTAVPPIPPKKKADC